MTYTPIKHIKRTMGRAAAGTEKLTTILRGIRFENLHQLRGHEPFLWHEPLLGIVLHRLAVLHHLREKCDEGWFVEFTAREGIKKL